MNYKLSRLLGVEEERSFQSLAELYTCSDKKRRRKEHVCLETGHNLKFKLNVDLNLRLKSFTC